MTDDDFVRLHAEREGKSGQRARKFLSLEDAASYQDWKDRTGFTGDDLTGSTRWDAVTKPFSAMRNDELLGTCPPEDLQTRFAFLQEMLRRFGGTVGTRLHPG